MDQEHIRMQVASLVAANMEYPDLAGFLQCCEEVFAWVWDGTVSSKTDESGAQDGQGR